MGWNQLFFVVILPLPNVATLFRTTRLPNFLGFYQKEGKEQTYEAFQLMALSKARKTELASFFENIVLIDNYKLDLLPFL